MNIEFFHRKKKEELPRATIDDFLGYLEPLIELHKKDIYARLQSSARRSQKGDVRYFIPDLERIGQSVILELSRWEVENNPLSYGGIPEIIESQILPLGLAPLAKTMLENGMKADDFFGAQENFDTIATKLGEIFQRLEGNDLVEIKPMP